VGLCVCVGVFVCLFVCGSVTTITRNCIARIDPHQTGFVGRPKGSDHLQLIKFWLSRAPAKGVCGGAKIFGSAVLQPARSVCVSRSAFFSFKKVMAAFQYVYGFGHLRSD